MKVKAVKGVKHDFSQGAGPSEVVTLGLEVDGDYIAIGTYYFGPYGGDAKDHYATMQRFIKECEHLFKESQKHLETIDQLKKKLDRAVELLEHLTQAMETGYTDPIELQVSEFLASLDQE